MSYINMFLYNRSTAETTASACCVEALLQTSFSTHTARWNMIPQFGWIDQWEIYDTVFTKHVTVKDSKDYTRSFLIHLKKIYPIFINIRKKNSKPLWCHQTWKIPELNRRIIELVFHVSHDLKVYVPRYRKLYPLVMTNSLLAGTWP